ncbi:hypothetical protein ACWEPN_15825 [Nonomuraea wenchangensis]
MVADGKRSQRSREAIFSTRLAPQAGHLRERPKAEIVELCRRGDRSVWQVAKDFDLTETAVRQWIRQVLPQA